MTSKNMKLKIITILVIALLLIATLTSILMLNLGTYRVFAFEYLEEDLLYYWTEDLYLEQNDYFGIEPMSSDDKKDEDGRHIKIRPYPHVVFEDAVYIPNADFFIRNPMHFWNSSSNLDQPKNIGGVCTSVAAQLVLSYHNYFTDRRIIPKWHGGERFLAEEYGNLNQWPGFNLRPQTRRWSEDAEVYRYESRSMCTSIGTTDVMFLNKFNHIPGIYWVNQTPSYVARGMRNFLEEHYRDGNSNRLDGNVTVTSNRASHNNVATRARAEIDAGRPVIIGLDWRTGGISGFAIHAVVAFGHHYLYLEGVRTHGFIVHLGWRRRDHHVWVRP